MAAKESLYSYLQGFVDKSTELTSSMRGNQVAFQVWREHGDFIVPWVKMDDLDASKGSFPSDCYVEEEAVEDETEEANPEEDADSDIANWVEDTGLLDFTSNTPNGLVDSPSSTSTSTIADTSGLSGTSSLPSLSTTTTSATTSTATSSATNAASSTSTTTASKMASNPNGRQGSKPKPQGSSSGGTRTRIRRKK